MVNKLGVVSLRMGIEQLHDNGAVILMVMTLILSAGLFIREDKELDNRVKDRDKQLIADYPGMVNKFVLFYSAGLTTRGIISKLCGDYRRKLNEGEEKRYLYEEMLICEGRMNEGLGELSAYEGFAARCGLHKYRQFISLVIQAAGKGRADLLPLLDREATEAFEERKNRAYEAAVPDAYDAARCADHSHGTRIYIIQELGGERKC